jgi:hypothetical protein
MQRAYLKLAILGNEVAASNEKRGETQMPGAWACAVAMENMHTTRALREIMG